MAKTPRADIIKLPYIVDKLNYRDSAAVAAAANEAAQRYHDATPAERAGRRNPLREEIRVHADAYYALRSEQRDLAVARGERNAGGGVDIVSYIDGDGVPDTDSPMGAEYWAVVERAAELGVPNVVGFQR